MLGDLRGINCEEERKFDRYIANYVIVTFFGGEGIVIRGIMKASVYVH